MLLLRDLLFGDYLVQSVRKRLRGMRERCGLMSVGERRTKFILLILACWAWRWIFMYICLMFFLNMSLAFGAGVWAYFNGRIFIHQKHCLYDLISVVYPSPM